MTQNEQILRKFQAGIESSRGTNVASTRIVYADISGNYDRPTSSFADRSGTYEQRRRHALGRPNVTFTATDLATYEDLAWWFQFAIKGGVTGTSDAGTPPAYVYNFVPSAATDDLKAMTLEHGVPDNVYESAQVMVNSWTLRGDPDSGDEPAWMFEAEMLGLDWEPSSYTAALASRTTEAILAPGTKIFVDEPGGTIGTTQWTDHLISWSVTGNNNIHFKAFAEHVDTMAPGKVGRQGRVFDAQFTFEFDSDAEFAKFRAGTQRLIRLQQDGSQVNATPTNNRLRLDMNGYWSTISWGERDGNITATMGLMGFYDVTNAKTFSAHVTNALATLP